MFTRLRGFFRRETNAADRLLRLGTASPVGFRLPAGLVHRAVAERESALRLGGSAYPIELRMSFLRDHTNDLATPELEAELLIRLRPEAATFRFGSNCAVAECVEASEARGAVIYFHHILSVGGLICTATLEVLSEQVPLPALHQFRDALPEIFRSLQPFGAQADAA